MINIGILGCGKQGHKHANALSERADIQVFVSDEETEKAKDFANKYGFKFSNNLFRESLSALLICTPTKFHFDAIRYAFNKNTHVFCEKPLVSNSKEFTLLENFFEKSRSILYVGFVYKFSPSIRKLYNLCKQNETTLGKPLHAIFRIGGRGDHQIWKHTEASGGVVNEMLVHMLDLSRWFLGDISIENVINESCIKPNRTINGKLINANQPDYISLIARSSVGSPILIQADLITQNFSQYFEIVFENGSCFGSIEPQVQSFLDVKGKDRININQDPSENLFNLQMDYFMDLIQGVDVTKLNTFFDYKAVDDLTKKIKRASI